MQVGEVLLRSTTPISAAQDRLAAASRGRARPISAGCLMIPGLPAFSLAEAAASVAHPANLGGPPPLFVRAHYLASRFRRVPPARDLRAVPLALPVDDLWRRAPPRDPL